MDDANLPSSSYPPPVLAGSEAVSSGGETKYLRKVSNCSAGPTCVTSCRLTKKYGKHYFKYTRHTLKPLGVVGLLNVTCHAWSRVPVWCSVTCHVSRRCSSLQQPRSATDSSLLCAVPAGLGWAASVTRQTVTTRRQAELQAATGRPAAARPSSTRTGAYRAAPRSYCKPTPAPRSVSFANQGELGWCGGDSCLQTCAA